MQADWIQAYGAWAVLLGGMLEGEAVFIAAGYAVSQGYLQPIPTFALAVLGASLGDQLFFAVGRLFGPRIIRAVPLLRRLRAHAVLQLRRWGRGAAFLTRFAYGLRIVLPITMGAARFPVRFFVPFNFLGALTFASLYLTLGYFFGEVMETVLAHMRGRELWILLGILAAGALAWVVREWWLIRTAPGDRDDALP